VTKFTLVESITKSFFPSLQAGWSTDTVMKMLLLASRINLIVFVLFGLTKGAYLIDFNRVYHRNLANVKREGEWPS